MQLSLKLQTALAESGLTVSELARRLAGPDAPHSRVGNERSAIYRWLRGGGISDEKAERLAEAFSLPTDHFKNARPRSSEIERLEAILAELHREVADLRRRLDES